MRNKQFAWAKLLSVYALLALLMRFLSFFPSVIDHDESTYILIADAIREGKIYLIDVVDTKPVGIFLLFGFFQSIFGESILAIRILTTLWIALTALGIHKVHESLGGVGQAPFASGVIYLVMTSIYTFYGISPNTELFFNLFTVIALWLLLQKPRTGHFFLAGLCLGAGFIIKFVVLFDALAFGVFFLWKAIKEKWVLRQAVVLSIACILGFAIPFASIFAYYWLNGYGSQFLFYTFEVSGNYFIERHWLDFIEFIFQAFARYAIVSFFFFYVLFDRSVPMREFKTLIILWSVFVFYIMLVPGKLFAHYFIQFMLPFSMLAGSFFDARRPLRGFLAKVFAPKIGYPVLVVIMIVNTLFQKKDYLEKPDYAAQIADYLDDRLKPEDVIYTGNYHQIIYHLLDKESPTPFVHRSLLWDVENVEALELNQNKELNKIMQQEPRYVIYQGDLPLQLDFGKTMQQDYQIIKSFPREINVYERIDRFSEKPMNGGTDADTSAQ